MRSQIFTAQNPNNYRYETRSIRLNGRSTSIRLETTFGRLLEELAESQQMSVPKLVSTLYQEVLERHVHVNKLSSLLRCESVLYLETVKSNNGIPVAAPFVVGTCCISKRSNSKT